MKSIKGGKMVEPGFYWNPSAWEIVPLPERGRLPGKSDDGYVKVPVAAMLIAAPVMGGLFVVFLPFLGFALLAQHVGSMGVAAVRRAASGSKDSSAVPSPVAGNDPRH